MSEPQLNRGGRNLPVDPDDASLAAVPEATRGLVAALNRLLVEARTSYVEVSRDQLVVRNKQYVSRQMRRPGGPEQQVIDAIVRQCIARTGRSEDSIRAAIQPHLPQAAAASPPTEHASREGPDDRTVDVDSARIAVLELLVTADVEPAADILVAAFRSSRPGMARIFAQIVKTDVDGATALLQALAVRDDVATAEQVLDALGEEDTELAQRVRSRWQPPAQPEPPDPAGSSIVDLDPEVFVARRRAAMIGRGQVATVCDELRLADESTPTENVLRIADLEPDGVDATGTLLTQMLRVGQIATVADVFTRLLGRAADQPRHVVLASRLLALLAPRDLRTVVLSVAAGADATLVARLAALLAAQPVRPDGAGPPRLVIDLVLSNAAEYPGEQASRVLRAVFAVLPDQTALDVLRSPEVGQAIASKGVSGHAVSAIAAALVEAVPGGMVEQLAGTDVRATALLVSLALEHWCERVGLAMPHKARTKLVKDVLTMRRSKPKRAADLLAQLAADHTSGLAILLNVAEGAKDTIDAAAVLLADVLSARPQAVDNVVALRLTTPGLPTQVLDAMVQRTPGAIEPVLRALVTESESRAEVHRLLLSEEARVNPELCRRLLRLLAERDPQGPWAYAADKLDHEPEQVAGLISDARLFAD